MRGHPDSALRDMQRQDIVGEITNSRAAETSSCSSGESENSAPKKPSFHGVGSTENLYHFGAGQGVILLHHFSNNLTAWRLCAVTFGTLLVVEHQCTRSSRNEAYKNS